MGATRKKGVPSRGRRGARAEVERLSTHKRRTSWFNARAAWPLREAGVEHVVEERRRAAAALAAAAGSHDWALAGPSNVGGRLTSLAVHPRDADVVWAGSAAGGVWKSSDAGRTWRALWHDEEVLNVGSLALDPSNPDVLYCGSGEANLSPDSYPGVGLYSSRDGGESWALLASVSQHGLPRRIGALAVDPFDARHLCLGGISHGCAAGLFVSRDRGRTWARDARLTPLETNCHALVFHPARRGVLFAALHERGARSGLWRSRDGGESWEHLTRGLPPPERFTRVSLALAPSDPEYVYALACDDRDRVLGVFVSRNGGDTWREIGGRHFERERQMFYNSALAVHPQHPQHVICGGVDLHLTTNGGRSWRRVTDWRAERGARDYAHSDHHALAMPAAAPGRVYDGNDGGLDVSEDGGRRWTNRSAGLAVTMFYDLDVAGCDPRVYGGGAQDNGTVVTHSGRADDFTTLTGGDGGWLLIDPRDAGHVYSSAQGMRVWRLKRGALRDVSPDLGGQPAPWMAFLAMDPRDSRRVFAGAQQVWRTVDDGLTWRAVSPVLDGSFVTAIEVAAANPRHVYVGTENGGVFRSLDGGASWSANLAGARLPGTTVTRLETHPRDARRLYLTVAGSRHAHVYRSSDAGTSWQDIDRGALPDVAHHAVVAAREPGKLFVCGDAGVYVTLDDGATWLDLSGNLPRVMCVDLVYHARTRALFVATYGRSLWKLAPA